MPSKVSTGFIVFGAVTIFAALCVLPAALAKDAESSLLATAAALFSMGALVIAAGVYLKARALQSQAPRPEGPAGRTPRSGQDASFVARKFRWCGAKCINWIYAAPAWAAITTTALVRIFPARIKASANQPGRWWRKTAVSRTRIWFLTAKVTRVFSLRLRYVSPIRHRATLVL